MAHFFVFVILACTASYRLVNQPGSLLVARFCRLHVLVPRLHRQQNGVILSGGD